MVAVGASIIASQAMISGAFSIIAQSLSLGCFPRVKVVHTSAKYEGQVYIPEVNWLLMIACVGVSAAFRTTEKIGNAYGIAVVTVMVITTCMLTLIMLVIWKTSMWLIALFLGVFGAVEAMYLSAVMYKFAQGGYLPLAFSMVLMMIMGIWHYVHKQRYMFELNNKVSSDYVRDLATDSNPDRVNRIPGIGLLYSELVQGIPPIFPHFVNRIPAIHSVLVFVSIKPIPISKVALEERFLFRQVEPREYRVFRCVVRYGYNDAVEEPEEFEKQLVEQLKEFIRHRSFIADITEADQQVVVKSRGSSARISSSAQVEPAAETSSPSVNMNSRSSSGSIRSSRINVSAPVQQGAEEEMQFVEQAKERGVVYLLGETHVVAAPKSSFFKKMVVNYAFHFLRNNFRQGDTAMAIPRARLLRVGMTYEI